ncbi:MAG TPA: 50S ribosomal protein L10 [Polyangiaceae bacterium]|jgi:large subunit ribosomal protein L10|nr:50S ribosomal protein L10 [Polyangiaceae bacterium]
MLRTDKETTISDLKQRFERMSSAVFVDFTGLTVAEATRLRNTFRAKGIEYRVVKNTLIKRALGDRPFVKNLTATLKGPTGVAWSYEEPSAAARVLKDYVKENEKLKIKAGLLEGQVLGAKAVETQLATLPSKDEARAMLLATLMAPAQQFVMLINTPASNFVRLLNAKKEKG